MGEIYSEFVGLLDSVDRLEQVDRAAAEVIAGQFELECSMSIPRPDAEHMTRLRALRAGAESAYAAAAVRRNREARHDELLSMTPLGRQVLSDRYSRDPLRARPSGMSEERKRQLWARHPVLARFVQGGRGK